MRLVTTMDLIDDYLEALLDDTPVAASAPGVQREAADDACVARLPTSPAPVPPAAPTPATVVEAAPRFVAPAPIATATPADLAPVAAPRWVRVTVAADSYALELLCVQEVVRLAPIVAMRGANHAVLGAMNLRGRIVPVVDLGLWLGFGCVQPDERSRIVVVERDDELIGVLVSTVEDVVTLGRDRIEPPLPGNDPGAVLGIARVGATPTVLLDANALYG